MGTLGTSQARKIVPTRVLVVGLGGLGSPALRVLVESGFRRFTLVDDDVVDVSNLQRQTLYTDAHVGMLKAEAARAVLGELVGDETTFDVKLVIDRFHPENALSLLQGHDLLLEGADNFATKFLAADAAHLARVPCVQAGAVRWTGWMLASLPGEGTCLRCIFEDVPRGQPETCAIAGVVGPVVGAMGALQAAACVRLAKGEQSAASVLWSYDALSGMLRRRRIARRASCPLCSGEIRDLDQGRYMASCAA